MSGFAHFQDTISSFVSYIQRCGAGGAVLPLQGCPARIAFYKCRKTHPLWKQISAGKFYSCSTNLHGTGEFVIAAIEKPETDFYFSVRRDWQHCSKITKL